MNMPLLVASPFPLHAKIALGKPDCSLGAPERSNINKAEQLYDLTLRTHSGLAVNHAARPCGFSPEPQNTSCSVRRQSQLQRYEPEAVASLARKSINTYPSIFLVGTDAESGAVSMLLGKPRTERGHYTLR